MWVFALVGLLSGDAAVVSHANADRIDAARAQALSGDYQDDLPRAGYGRDHDMPDPGSGTPRPTDVGRDDAGHGSAGSSTDGPDGSDALTATDPNRSRFRRVRPRGDWQGRDGNAPDRRQRQHDDGDAPGPLGTLFHYLLWGIVLVLLAIGVFWIASELLGKRDDAKLADDDADDAKPDDAIDVAVVEKPLDDADEWARRGNFTEAIHALLLRTLQELVRSNAMRVAPATTSREILARVPLLADARTALAGLITAVEVTHFGNNVATAEDYERCRQQFGLFATAFRARGAAA